MFPPSLLVIPQGWGLIDLPLRASNEGSRDRALREHRRSTGSIPSLFREQKDGQATPLLLLALDPIKKEHPFE